MVRESGTARLGSKRAPRAYKSLGMRLGKTNDRRGLPLIWWWVWSWVWLGILLIIEFDLYGYASCADAFYEFTSGLIIARVHLKTLCLCDSS